MNFDGGKNGEGTYHKLMMPPHRVFIEAFFGSGAITRRKKPAQLNIGIELDARTIAAVQPSLSVVAVTRAEMFPLVPGVSRSALADSSPMTKQEKLSTVRAHLAVTRKAIRRSPESLALELLTEVVHDLVESKGAAAKAKR